jgi:hypothetical protein
MFNPSKQMMEKYKTLLIKMALGSPTNEQVKLNYKHIYDLWIFLDLLAFCFSGVHACSP